MPQRNRKPDFKLGADPEFGFLSGGDLTCAGEVIDYADEDGQFGIDGGGDVAEIRPSPAEKPADLVANIRRAMQKGIIAAPEALDYEWKAGSMADGHPTGGHLHFGTLNLQTRRANVSTLVNMLDIYLAQIAVLLEDPDEARERRCDSDYGQLGDYRTQAWGFEYRCLGSWLTSPYVAAAILALGKTVVHETLFNGLANASRKHLRPDVDTFNEARMEKLRGRFRPLWKDISKFELYKRHSKSIGLIKRLVSKRLTWFPKCGTREAWGLIEVRPAHEQSMPNMTMAKIWGELASENTAPRLREEQLT